MAAKLINGEGIYCSACLNGNHENHGSHVDGWACLTPGCECKATTGPATDAASEMQIARAKGNEGALLKYWTKVNGGGAGKAGDFEECVATLGKHADIDNPEVLCAWLHKQTTGAMPGHAADEDKAKRTINLGRALAELNQWERWALKRVGAIPLQPFEFAVVPPDVSAGLSGIEAGQHIPSADHVRLMRYDAQGHLEEVLARAADDNEPDEDAEPESDSTVEQHRDANTNAFARALVGLWLALKAGELTHAAFGQEYADLWESHSTAAREKIAKAYGVTVEALATESASALEKLAARAGVGASQMATRIASGVEELAPSTAQLTSGADRVAGSMWASHWGLEAYAVLDRDTGKVAGEGRNLRAKKATWETSGDDRVCVDCSDRSQQEWELGDPEMPLPGDGTTACGGACRCALIFS